MKRFQRRLHSVPTLAAAFSLALALSACGGRKAPEPPAAPGTVRGLSPSGKIASLPARFVWTRDPQAVFYRFEIRSVLVRRVFTTVVRDTTFVLEPGMVDVKELKSATWRVITMDGTGIEQKPSEIVPIDLTGAQ